MGKIEWTIGPRNFPIAGILPISGVEWVLVRWGAVGYPGGGCGALAGEEVQEESVYLVRGVQLHPVARAFQALVSP
jgi:hypothetical protein